MEVLAADPDAEALRPVVEEAVRYRLEGLGLAVRLRGSPAAASRPGRTPAPAPSILESAARGGAEFALECRYSGSGSRMSLQLSWYEVSTRLMTAAVDRKGRVDLVLDSLILDALDELLDRVRGRIEERVAAYGPRVRPAPAGASTTVGPVAGGPGTSAGLPGPAGPAGRSPDAGGGLPAGSPALETGAGIGAGPGSMPGPGSVPGSEPGVGPSVGPGVGPAVVPGSEPPPPAGRYAGARLQITPSVAPFLAVGAASYYFPIGYQSILQIGFLPAGAGARLGLGALLGVTAFQAQGASESSLGFLLPVGLSVRYSMELGGRWGLLFHLGGGAAVLVMGTDSLGSLAKMLPYVRSGLGLELALGRSLGLGLEASYEVFFESPYLIMGFTPGLCLSWRL